MPEPDLENKEEMPKVAQIVLVFADAEFRVDCGILK